MTRDVVKSVLIAVMTGAIFFLSASIRDLVMEVHDLRGDVDRLYSLVDDMAKGTP